MKVPTVQYTYRHSKGWHIAFVQKSGEGFAVKYCSNIFFGDTIPDAFRKASIEGVTEDMYTPKFIADCMRYLDSCDPDNYMEEFVKE